MNDWKTARWSWKKTETKQIIDHWKRRWGHLKKAYNFTDKIRISNHPAFLLVYFFYFIFFRTRAPFTPTLRLLALLPTQHVLLDLVVWRQFSDSVAKAYCPGNDLLMKWVPNGRRCSQHHFGSYTALVSCSEVSGCWPQPWLWHAS